MSEVALDDQEPVLRVETIWEGTYATLAHIALRGTNQRAINHGSTMIYGVLSGIGTMIVDGVRHSLQAGVLIEVPQDTPYQDFGNVDMLAISIPPFAIDT